MSQWITALLLSPATGEQKSMWPWIVGGVGLVALAAFVVLSIMQKKKTPPHDENSPMSGEPPMESFADVTEPVSPTAPEDTPSSEPVQDSQPEDTP